MAYLNFLFHARIPRVCFPLLAIVFVVFPLRESNAQDIQDIGSFFESNPDSAYVIASQWHITNQTIDTGYERFLAVLGIINYPKLTDQQFDRYITSEIGKNVKTPIQQLPSITHRDSAKWSICTYDMPLAGDRVLHYEVWSFPLLISSENDQLVFVGTLAEIKKTGDGYRIIIKPAKGVVVAGDDIISTYEHQKLLNALNSENWKDAAEFTDEYMSRFYLDPYGQQAALRFMHLYAIAGMTSHRQMTYKELKKEIDGLEGAPVAVPGREFSTRSYAGLNRVSLHNDTADIAFTDSAGIHIHIFVYAKLTEVPKDIPHDGDRVQIFGVIHSLETNPNESEVWVLRMTLENAEMKVVE